MNLQEQLDEAICIAAKYHKGQKDKQDVNYILHPLSVMMRVNTVEEKITAVLHDILEDTIVTEEELRNWGFSEHIVDAVVCLTRDENIDYFEYIEKVKQNPLAKIIKIADLKDNMRDGCPLGLYKRYQKAMKIIEE